MPYSQEIHVSASSPSFQVSTHSPSPVLAWRGQRREACLTETYPWIWTGWGSYLLQAGKRCKTLTPAFPITMAITISVVILWRVKHAPAVLVAQQHSGLRNAGSCWLRRCNTTGLHVAECCSLRNAMKFFETAFSPTIPPAAGPKFEPQSLSTAVAPPSVCDLREFL